MAYVENSNGVSDCEAFGNYSREPKGKIETGELSQMPMFFMETLQLNG
jgi:hypothetical protein